MDATGIKREPREAPPPPPPPPPMLRAPPPAPTASAAKRDHLRALLDRARANKTRGAVEVKSEPTRAPDAWGCVDATGQGGLLPTPGSTAARSTQAAAPPPIHHAPHPSPQDAALARGPPVHYHDHNPALSYPARASFQNGAPGSSSFYSPPATVAPPPTHAYSQPVATNEATYSQAYHPEPSPHWHYQAHHPPSLAIPSRPPYAASDHDVIDRAPTPLTTTISPSMSATTSTSSSSNTTRRSRAASPASRSPAISTKRPRDHAMKLDTTRAERRTLAAPKPAKATEPSLDEYEDNELHSDFVHTVHMLIPEGSFGCLVGHRGEYIKEINAASECTLSVRDESSFPMFETDRVLRIYGKPKGICRAQELVIARIREFRAEKQDSSYVDLGDDLLVPMTKSSVTRAMTEAIEAADGEDDPDAAAQQGELRWLIHKSDVGKIMGQHGSIQKAIARETNTTIHVVPVQNMAPGSAERTVIITGEPADIKRALASVKAKAGGRLDTHNANPGKSGQYYVLPQHVTGFLIGPKGTRIRKVREETGASIQIAAQQDLPLGYVNRMLHVQGTNDQMDAARAAIVRRLQSYMNSPEATSDAQEDEIALQLVLPVRICSFLLDQRGRLIREISEKAGAHARFLPPFDDDSRVCVLYGDKPKVFRAERLVLQFIAGDAIANKWASAGGAPPRKRRRVSERAEDDDSEPLDEVLDSDDEVILAGMRGRPRKRLQPESSGRIVVHYTAPTKPSSSRGSSRHASSGRSNAHIKQNGRNKRRR